MAKRTKPKGHEDWEVHDAMHTMMRAGEIIKDKALMSKVRAKAKDHARKMSAVASQADSLARRGLISEKQMSKLKSKGQGGSVKDLDKETPIASGTEGDRSSSNSMGISRH